MGGSGGGAPRRLEFFRILKEIVYDFQYMTMIFQQFLNILRNYEKLANFREKHIEQYLFQTKFCLQFFCKIYPVLKQ